MIRNPVMAGHFYPGTRSALEKELASLIDTKAKKVDAIGALSPHAGYVYSGSVAGSVLSAIKAKPIYIIMGPNHTGLGASFGIETSQSWRTPLGDVPVDAALAREILKHSKLVSFDSLSHTQEHSIEVQLPFLQFLQGEFSIVPIVISYADLDSYREGGTAIARSVKALGIEKEVAIIASSDMTHYESRQSAQKKDAAAIEALLALDEKKLVERVSEYDITMCGFAPAAIMLAAAKALGAKNARLVKYQTSGEISGDYSSVVGYAGIVIT